MNENATEIRRKTDEEKLKEYRDKQSQAKQRGPRNDPNRRKNLLKPHPMGRGDYYSC